jgi:Spy/CpxP family protein refolding chaperone
MNANRKRAWALAIVLILLAGGLAAAAPRGREGARAKRGERIAVALDLSAEQRRAIDEIRTSRWNEGLGDAVRRHMDSRRALEEAITDDSASRESIAEAARAHADAEEVLALERRKTQLAFDAILTPEQRAKHDDLRTRRDERRRRAFAARDAWARAGETE